jgi:hypothetical protein
MEDFATLRLNGATMKKAASNGSYRRKANSRESDIVEEKITYESALREEGIDEVFVARKLRGLLRAQWRRWDPKKGCLEKCEDYDTQIAALRRLPRFVACTGRTQKAQMFRS